MFNFISVQRQKYLVNSIHARRNRWIVTVTAIILLVIAVILIQVNYGWSWIGIGGANVQELAEDVPQLVIIRDAPNPKTLWDFLELFVVPASLLLIGYVLTQRQDRRAKQEAEQREAIDRDIAKDRVEESAMENYFNTIAALLPQIKKPLEDGGKEAQELARIHTLTLLPRLNGRRKGYVLLFLNELKLIGIREQEPLVNLAGANLQGIDLTENNLPDSDFSYISLEGTYLSKANMAGARLTGANLAYSKLLGAELVGANLRGANLRGAILLRTDLGGALLHDAKLDDVQLLNMDLTGVDLGEARVGNIQYDDTTDNDEDDKPADLRSADLRGAILRSVKLEEAKLKQASLQGVKYDNRTKWPEGYAPEKK